MERKLVSAKVENGVRYIMLDSPASFNVIDITLMTDLLEALQVAEADPETKVIVLGSTAKVFSAGGDLATLKQQAQDQKTEAMKVLVEKVAEIILYMKQMKKLIIAAVNGATAGAGFSLVLAADRIIASEKAVFMTAFIKVGLVSDGANFYLLSKQIGASRAMHYSLTSEAIKGSEAYSIGLVSQVVPADDLMENTKRVAEQLATGPLSAYENLKALNYHSNYEDLEKYLQLETTKQTEAMQTEQFIEGTTAFLEKRTPNFNQ